MMNLRKYQIETTAFMEHLFIRLRRFCNIFAVGFDKNNISTAHSVCESEGPAR